MPSKWLTWTPKSVNSASVERTRPIKDDAESSREGFVGFDGRGASVSPKFTIPVGEGQKVFPHCPGCASYYLYRKGNVGNYQCETCGLTEISETVARRIQ